MALNHSVKGSVDYTIVGTPTIVDGVVSGFSNNDYLVVDAVPLNTTEYHLQTEFTTESAVSSTNGVIIGCYDGLYGAWGIVQKTNGDLNWVTGYLYDTDTQQHFYEEIPTGLTFVANTKYYVDYHYSFADKLFTMKLSTDKINWTTKTASFTLDSAIAGGSNKTIGIGKGQEGYFNGSVDLNKTFIKINGQAWFGVCPVEVKHINYGTSVGYTKVGNPTIVDGVASGFSTSDYLRLPYLPGQSSEYFTVRYPFVEQIAFNSGNSNIVGYLLYGNMSAIVFTNGNNRYIKLVFNNGNDPIYVNGNIVIQDNTDCVLRISFDGSKVVSEIKQGSGSFVQDVISNEIVTFIADYEFIGVRPASADSEFGGSIDLNETYIKVNDSMWFFRPCVNYLKRDDKLVFADSDLYLTGPVNYTVVGTPMIVDNVASGFSSSNNLIISSLLQSTNRYEYSCTFTMPDSFSGLSVLLSLIVGPNNDRGLDIYYNGSSCYLHANMAYADGTYEGQWISTTALQPSETYTGKLIRDNDNTYRLELWQNGTKIDSTSWTKNSGIVTTELVIGGKGYPFVGSIDLNETYIKVNGNLWFYGKNYASANIAPIKAGYHIEGQVGCAAVGSPTIISGVASGFSVDDYLSLSQSFSNASSFEMVFKVKFDSTLQGGIFHSNCIALQKYDGGNLELLYKNTSDSWQAIRGGGSLPQADTWCWIKVGYQSGSISLDFSSDGSSYTNVGTASYTLNNYNINNPWLGRFGNTVYFHGNIDLDNTYIKVNDKMWFDGKGQYPFTGWVDMRTQVFTKAPTGAELNPVAPIVVPSRTVSGFSSLNYYDFGQFPSTITDFKFIVRGSVTSTSQRHNMLLAAGWDAGYQYSYNIRSTTGKPSLYCNQWYDGNSAVSANTNYWYYIIKSNGNYLYYTIEDNGYSIDSLPSLSNWTLQVTNTTEMANLTWRLGQNPQSTDQFWVGSMDQIRLEINNQKVFDLYDSGAKALLEASGLTVTES